MEVAKQRRRVCRFLHDVIVLIGCLLAITAMAFGGQARKIVVGEIYYFGYGGVDLKQITRELPVHRGDVFTLDTWASATGRIKAMIAKVTSRPPTDLAEVCCDTRGQMLLYIGLPGSTTRRFAYNPAPSGNTQLPRPGLQLYHATFEALVAAIRAHAADEDDSRGYALSTYPPLHEKELALRAYALKHGPVLRQALQSAADTEQRAAAAEALGYAQESAEQIAALVHAARDPNEIVRNNATRALVVLAASSSSVARQIPPDDFIAMLSSGTWTDRNKASFLLMYLTRDRNATLLAKLREQALPALIEIARWDRAHALSALTILGRIAGIPEERLEKMDADAIIRAADL